ncbi:MAG: hypothetical protein HND49_06665 [Planctomycetes bacterium]|nr:hypothetical protein [Planctomycetota bacterium]
MSSKFRGSVLQWIILSLLSMVAGVGAIKTAELPPQWIVLVSLALLFLFVVILYGNIRKSLLTLILFDIPFQFDINIGYRDEVAEFGALGGWNLSITSIALLALYTLWFLETSGNRDNDSRVNNFYYSIRPLTVYIGFCLLSIVVARDTELSLFKNFMLLQQFLLFVYIIGTVKSREDIKFILGLLFIGVVLEGTIFILLYKIGHTIEIAGLSARVDKGLRIGGTVGGPNTAGSYFALLLVPALSMILANVRNSFKWLGIVSFCLGTVALILTFSRGGFLAFTLSITIFIFVSWYRGWLPLLVPIVLVIVTILVALCFHQVLIDRIFGDDDGAALSRIPLIKLALQIIVANPLLGVGVNNFTIIMKDYITGDLRGMWLYAVHNKYLLVWAEIGTGGLVAFLWFLGSSIRNSWKSWQTQDPLLAPVGLALSCAIVGHMVHMNFDTFQKRPTIQVFWICCALSLAIFNSLKSERSELKGRVQA